MFNLTTKFVPIDEQKKATQKLVDGLLKNKKDQVLLGVTGSGKTFTMANVIKESNLPTLIISHNKTLAGQLYGEMKSFFEENAVSYFISYYDFYQPEAYLPSSDTYIEKEAQINEYIDKMRLSATANLLTRDDVIVVASVSCIYNIGSPVEYGRNVAEIKIGGIFEQQSFIKSLVELQYVRSEFDFKRGTFRIRSNTIDVYPSYGDDGLRIETDGRLVIKISVINSITGKKINELQTAIIYPAKHYMIDKGIFEDVSEKIRRDLQVESQALMKQGKTIEADRLIKKVTYDLEMIKEIGYVNGIENYSRYFDKRPPGAPPYSLVEYFNYRFGTDWLCIIDESHMTIPQIRGMYNGDYARKQTLVDYGFRLKASFDNRPLKFDEFYRATHKLIYASATPSEWEIQKSEGNIVEQLVRPTGIVDPAVDIRPTEGEIPDLIEEIKNRVEKGERVLVTTLTKRIAEDLTTYLKEQDVSCAYLHSDVKTLKRTDILNKLRKKEYDVLIGVNLLREGLDLPEVTLVAILDADKTGFLRSKTALVQTMGRAARNVGGKVIMYADNITQAIKQAVDEVDRRRKYQLEYNKKNNIKPKTIQKKISEALEYHDDESNEERNPSNEMLAKTLKSSRLDDMTSIDKQKYKRLLEKQMREYVEDLNFEAAILVRDKLRTI